MTAEDADLFLRAAQDTMYFGRTNCMVNVDDVTWVLGFVQGAPYQQTTAKDNFTARRDSLINQKLQDRFE